ADVVYALAKLTAMLAVVGLAASTTEATGSLATQFALCQATLHLILVALYIRAEPASALLGPRGGPPRRGGPRGRPCRPGSATSAGRSPSQPRRPPLSWRQC